MLKALLVLEIFTLLSEPFGYIGKWLDKEARVNFKIYDVTDWTTNSYIFCPISEEVKIIR